MFPLVRALLLVTLSLALPSDVLSQTSGWKVGDRVEAYDGSAYQWYSGAVSQVGTGAKAGDFLVKWDKWSGSLWVASKNIRVDGAGAKAKAALTQSQATTPPRLAKYLIMSYGDPTRPPLHLGYFELLANGSYRSLDMGSNVLGSGRYTYDVTSKLIQWKSGPFLTAGWDGKFEITREGKTHNVQLRRGTFGTNSTS